MSNIEYEAKIYDIDPADIAGYGCAPMGNTLL